MVDAQAAVGTQKFSITDESLVLADPNAQLMFIDGAKGFAASDDGLVRFNFFQNILQVATDKTEVPVQRKVCLHVVMTKHVAASVGAWLLQNIKDTGDGGGKQ